MPDELCPDCGKTYDKTTPFGTTTIRYIHPDGTHCDVALTMPGNPNKHQSIPPDVLRRQGALKSK